LQPDIEAAFLLAGPQIVLDQLTAVPEAGKGHGYQNLAVRGFPHPVGTRVRRVPESNRHAVDLTGDQVHDRELTRTEQRDQ